MGVFSLTLGDVCSSFPSYSYASPQPHLVSISRILSRVHSCSRHHRFVLRRILLKQMQWEGTVPATCFTLDGLQDDMMFATTNKIMAVSHIQSDIKCMDDYASNSVLADERQAQIAANSKKDIDVERIFRSSNAQLNSHRAMSSREGKVQAEGDTGRGTLSGIDATYDLECKNNFQTASNLQNCGGRKMQGKISQQPELSEDSAKESSVQRDVFLTSEDQRQYELPARNLQDERTFGDERMSRTQAMQIANVEEVGPYGRDSNQQQGLIGSCQRGSNQQGLHKEKGSDPSATAGKQFNAIGGNPLVPRGGLNGKGEELQRLMDEGEALLNEGKEGLSGTIEVGVAESMLYEAANKFASAAAIDPSSLEAVGSFGNTLLVHGELKLKLSRVLRNMLSPENSRWAYVSGRRTMKNGDRRKARNEQAAIEQALQAVCEECEELLVEAGRKYRMALSIDRLDVRALYNWSLALCFRAQLIAEEGGENAAQDVDKVYLAAIDKIETLMGVSQTYAPGALLNWGLALRDRSHLRSMGSRERIKLLLQAKRLFQDALQFDPNYNQARRAISACSLELEELQEYEDAQSMLEQQN